MYAHNMGPEKIELVHSEAARPGQAQGQAAAPGEAFLALNGIGKSFGGFNALRDINLDVAEGEFICFLGPSGCGKSTLLRIIAGLETQTTGRIYQGKREISDLPAAARHFGILFQSYALFPNLTVADNVAYGLYNQRLPRAVIRDKVAELLDLVELSGADRKYPAQLSGGQQQRVALARAIAPSPRLLLLDEPLSALDAKVRVYLREKIRELQKRLGLTTIMVTHDQEEALTMADRIVVMDNGTVDQIGTPGEIYNFPRTPFVAGFIGKTNLIKGTAQGDQVQLGTARYPRIKQDTGPTTGPIEVSIRPENIALRRMDGTGAEAGVQSAVVDKMEFLGTFWRIRLLTKALGGAELIVDVPTTGSLEQPFALGETVLFTPDPRRFSCFAARPERAQGTRGH